MRLGECECGQNLRTFKARDNHVPGAAPRRRGPGSSPAICYADLEVWPCSYVVLDHNRRNHDHPEPGTVVPVPDEPGQN